MLHSGANERVSAMAANRTAAQVLYAAEMRAARSAVTAAEQWGHLERAHIVSQCPSLIRGCTPAITSPC